MDFLTGKWPMALIVAKLQADCGVRVRYRD
jgi:hypothetical protein